MPIYKRGDRWWIDFRVRRRRYRELSGYSKDVATRYLLKRRAEVEAGVLVPSFKSMTLREWSGSFLEWSRSTKSSWKRDESSVAHLLDRLGSLRLDEIDARAIERYQRERRRETSRFGRPPTPATINREVACLKRMLSIAVRDRVLPQHHARGVKMLDEHNVRSRILTDAELVAILTAADAWLRPLIALAYWTGMRRGEIVALRWDQVDLERGFVRLETGDTKTRQSRSVPLAGPALGILACQPRPTKPKRGVRVFPGVHADSVSKGFAAACAEAEVEGATFHDLRHTAVTRWADRGFDQKLIMAATGHKTDSVFRRYRAATEDRLLALVMDTRTDTENSVKS